MIKAVVFDYGNVISCAKTGDCADEMEKLTGIPADLFRSVYSRFGVDFDRGLITGAEMYSMLLNSEGYTDLAKNEDLMKKIAYLDMQSWRAWGEDATEWAFFLKKSGYKLGVLSNMPREFLQYYGDEIPIFTNADYACFSCNIGFVKPEPEIYYNVLNGLNVKPEETVFFDDIKENVDAANKIGINGFVWTGLSQAKIDFENKIAETKKK